MVLSSLTCGLPTPEALFKVGNGLNLVRKVTSCSMGGVLAVPRGSSFCSPLPFSETKAQPLKLFLPVGYCGMKRMLLFPFLLPAGCSSYWESHLGKGPG